MAREAARRAQCANHVKQLALAMHAFHNAQNCLPSAGWGWYNWAPHPDRGLGIEQPGCWTYSLLPFLEQQGLFELGAGAGANNVTAQLKAANKIRLGTPLNVCYCPTRRPPDPYPPGAGWIATPTLSDACTVIGHTDYAVNNGDFWPLWGQGPSDIAGADGYFAGTTAYRNGLKYHNGIIFSHYCGTFAEITDGLSNTYMIGEKGVNPDCYTDGSWVGDDQGPFISDDYDNARTAGMELPNPASPSSPSNQGAYLAPLQDTPGIDPGYRFGSAHSDGFNMSLCDASVKFINYTIGEPVHRHLANRQDGEAIDAKDF
jgi:hypothetical protein